MRSDGAGSAGATHNQDSDKSSMRGNNGSDNLGDADGLRDRNVTIAAGSSAPTTHNSGQQPGIDPTQQRQGRWRFFLIILVCAFPLLGSYFTYYVIKPQGRTNYGDLLDPRLYPIPALGSSGLDGKPLALDAFKGKWLMLQVSGGACTDACQKRLYDMRQLRAAQGKERERIERVWLITDDAPLDTIVMREFDGTRLLRVKPELLKAWLPVTSGSSATDHIYLIDPLGNLMMRFPKDADPNRIKKDLSKLLKASAIG